MNRNEILKVIYVQKDYLLAEKLCAAKPDDVKTLLMLARVLFYEKKYELAEVLFKKLHCYTEYGYCKLFRGDKESAKYIWESLEDISPLTMWAKCLSGYIEKKQKRTPTFFQIRNFYESDLDTLLGLRYTKWAENLINSIQYFRDINTEVYKYTARVLYNHKYYQLAEKFLNTGKNVAYEDTELHYIEAEVRLAQNQKIAAKKSLEKILEFAPAYYPAKKLLENIK